MCSREPTPPAPRFPDVTFRTAPNWTAVAFLGLLAGAHVANALPAFWAGRGGGYLSLALAGIFAASAVAAYFARGELRVLCASRVVCVRGGVGPLRGERSVPFDCVRAVRVTLGPRASADDSCVELLCARGDVTCPPTSVPRQAGLLLAMMIGAPLMTACADAPAAACDRDGAGERLSVPGR